MGFGGGSLSGQNSALVASMLSQQNTLAGQQTAAAGQVQSEDSAIVSQFRTNLSQMEGATQQQQKKTANLGLMDYIKTSPQGLSNAPAPKTGLMSLL